MRKAASSQPLWRFSNLCLGFLVFLVLFIVVVVVLAIRASSSQPSSTSRVRPQVSDEDLELVGGGGASFLSPSPPALLQKPSSDPNLEGLRLEIAALQVDLQRQQEEVARQKAQILAQLNGLLEKLETNPAASPSIGLQPQLAPPPPPPPQPVPVYSPPPPPPPPPAPLPPPAPPASLQQQQLASSRQRIVESRRESVKQGFLFGWNKYKEFAWGADELDPLGKRGKDWLGLAATIVDSLDTLWIMDLKEEFKLARDYVDQRLSFDTPKSVSVFETCIRDLGGLCAAYEFSRDRMFLLKAEDLAHRLLAAFDTPSGLPRASVDLRSGRSANPSWTGGSSILSEMGTMQLEFTYLAYHLGKPELAAKVNRVFKHLDGLTKPKAGLYPLYVNPQDGGFRGQQVSLGALGDSFYEYLIKMWVFTGKKLPGLRRMYDECSDGINNVLVQSSIPSGFKYVAELNSGGSLHYKMDELACFVGGMFALGAASQPANPRARRDLDLGAAITETCYNFWHKMPTGIAPELVNFRTGQDFVPGDNAKHYLLRPETVESLFVLWRTTGDPKFQDWGWEIWQSIEKWCKTPNGFAGIRDVTNTNHVQHDDTQQSFFFAETLKYLYLLFSPNDLIPLDKYVFNTEAHPLGIIDNYDWPTSWTDHLPR